MAVLWIVDKDPVQSWNLHIHLRSMPACSWPGSKAISIIVCYFFRCHIWHLQYTGQCVWCGSPICGWCNHSGWCESFTFLRLLRVPVFGLMTNFPTTFLGKRLLLVPVQPMQFQSTISEFSSRLEDSFWHSSWILLDGSIGFHHIWPWWNCWMGPYWKERWASKGCFWTYAFNALQWIAISANEWTAFKISC